MKDAMEQTHDGKALAAGAASPQKRGRNFERELRLCQLRQEKIMLERRMAEIEGCIAQTEATDANQL